MNFNVSSGKSENLHFVKTILFLSQKSEEELCAIKLKNDAKFKEELTCSL